MKASQVLRIKAAELNDDILMKVAEDLAALELDTQVFTKTATTQIDAVPAPGLQPNMQPLDNGTSSLDDQQQVVVAAPDPDNLPHMDGDRAEKPLLVDTLIASLAPTPESTPGPSVDAGSPEVKDELQNKQAGVADMLLSAGKTLMGNSTLRNAAIGAGVGAVGGAITAQPGQGLKGALKGAALGGAVGGLGTVAAKGLANPAVQSAQGIMPKLQAFKSVAGKELGAVADTASTAYKAIVPKKPQGQM